MKKKRRKKRYGFLAFFFVLFFGGGIAFYVYGQTDTTTTATNVVTVGKVDVELAMATHDAGVIAPDDKINNMVAVKNVGDYPAYIRMFVKKHWEISEGGVKLTQEAIATKYPKLSVDAIAIQLKDGWTKGTSSLLDSGYECYYYNEVVADARTRTVDAIQFSDSYQLKTEQTTGDGGITNELLVNFTKNGAKVNGYYEVIVEAIQADTCIPVKNGENKIINWNNMPDSFATMPPVSFDPAATPVGVVNFTSENTEITNASAFITMNNLVPGKTDGRVVEIKNTSNQKLPVYVYAESAEDYNSLSEKQKKWLEQLQLIVAKKDGTILYKDSLYKQNSKEPMLSKENPILIDNFPANNSQNLYVALHCPASWSEGDIKVKVNWIFASSKAIPTNTKKPSGDDPVIITTNTPMITEEPVQGTKVPEPDTPEPDMPEPTKVPEVSPSPAATLEVTVSPMVTLTPSEKPEVSSVVVTEEPDWEEEESDSTETAKPENAYKVTEEPVSTPKATDDGKPMESEETDGPIETLEPDLTSDERPRRTSTPKLPTTVEEVYPTKTGDATPIVVWLVLFVVSLVGTISAFTAYRKRR